MIIFFILFFLLGYHQSKASAECRSFTGAPILGSLTHFILPAPGKIVLAVSFGPAALTAVFPLYSVSFCFMLFLYSPGVIPQCFLNTLPKPFAVA